MSFFYSDAPEEDDILYGWVFDPFTGRYLPIYAESYCAPFPRPAPTGLPQHPNHSRPLYVKYLRDYIDEYLLGCMFSPFGTVIGTKIFRNRYGYSKKCGLVWFSNEWEACNAGYWMNGRLIEDHEIYVAPAEYWEERQARLAAESGRQDDRYYEEYDEDYYDEEDQAYYDEKDQACYYDGDQAYHDALGYYTQPETEPKPVHQVQPTPDLKLKLAPAGSAAA